MSRPLRRVYVAGALLDPGTVDAMWLWFLPEYGYLHRDHRGDPGIAVAVQRVVPRLQWIARGRPEIPGQVRWQSGHGLGVAVHMRKRLVVSGLGEVATRAVRKLWRRS